MGIRDIISLPPNENDIYETSSIRKMRKVLTFLGMRSGNEMIRFVYNPDYPDSLFIELSFTSDKKIWTSLSKNGTIGSLFDEELHTQDNDVELSKEETASVVQAILDHLQEVSKNERSV